MSSISFYFESPPFRKNEQSYMSVDDGHAELADVVICDAGIKRNRRLKSKWHAEPIRICEMLNGFRFRRVWEFDAAV